jgi:hypothetical protein
MTQSDRLFGHLALRFGVHPENLATDALTYILQSTPTARRALIETARTTGVELPDELSFFVTRLSVTIRQCLMLLASTLMAWSAS